MCPRMPQCFLCNYPFWSDIWGGPRSQGSRNQNLTGPLKIIQQRSSSSPYELQLMLKLESRLRQTSFKKYGHLIPSHTDKLSVKVIMGYSKSARLNERTVLTATLRQLRSSSYLDFTTTNHRNRIFFLRLLLGKSRQQKLQCISISLWT